MALTYRGSAPRARGANRFQPKTQIGVGGLELGARERRYLNEVIKSNRLSYGPFSERFERLFAKLHSCKHAVFCSSGTAALWLAVGALKEMYAWRDGDEILVPATTFIATSNVVLHHNMRPVFVDVDPATYNVNPAEIEKHVTPATRAIMPVHLMGLPADMAPILSIATRHKLRVIEDSCETMFARYRGSPVGSMGDIGCFSTYIAHFIVAGIGGFATTNNPDLAVIMRSLMNHGRDAIYLNIDDDSGVSREKLLKIVANRFAFIRVGHNFRATEMEAAIGLAQLENRKTIIRARHQNAQYFIRELAILQDHLQLPHIPAGHEHMFMLFPIVVRSARKQELVNYLEERLIETRDMFPLVAQPIYEKLFGPMSDQYPVARRISEQGFYIGCHQYLKPQEREYVVRTIKSFFGS
jgi:dTDP-4-amino-4,6-dideoxygalactose transaminase